MGRSQSRAKIRREVSQSVERILDGPKPARKFGGGKSEVKTGRRYKKAARNGRLNQKR